MMSIHIHWKYAKNSKFSNRDVIAIFPAEITMRTRKRWNTMKRKTTKLKPNKTKMPDSFRNWKCEWNKIKCYYKIAAYAATCFFSSQCEIRQKIWIYMLITVRMSMTRIDRCWAVPYVGNYSAKINNSQ